MKNYKPLIFIALFLVVGSIIFYNLYMAHSKKIWSFYFDEVKSSPILNEEFGEIKEVKMNNFLNWYSKKKGYNCIKMKITTEKGTYKICKVNSEEEYIYIVNDKIYQDTYSMALFKINDDKTEEFKKDFDNYFVKELKTDQDKLKYSRLIKKEDNTFKFTTSCDYNNIDKCAEKNKEYLDEITSNVGKEYSYELLDEIKVLSQ